MGGTKTPLYLSEPTIPLDRPPVLGMYRIVNGRVPTDPGEVVVQPEVLAAFGLQIGDDITLEDKGYTFRVTGTVVDPEALHEPVGVTAPGSLPVQPKSYDGDGFLVDLPPGASLDAARASLEGAGVRADLIVSRAQAAEVLPAGRSEATAGSFAATALVLLGTVLIAGAAFAVGARRQLRTLGLIGAAGGEPRHVRATVLMGGVSLGLVGSLTGVALGIAGAFAIRPQLDRLAGRIVGPVEIPVLPLLGALVLGIGAATLAAYGPARSVARISTIQALAGRTPPPRRPGKVAVAGLVAVAVGAAVTTWGTKRMSGLWASVGLTTMIAGFLVAIPLVVGWVGKLAGAMPTTLRLATRDIARHGRRTGAALAAAAVALAMPVAVATYTLSDEAHERQIPFMADDQLTIDVQGHGDEWQARKDAMAAELRTAFPGAVVALYQPAVTMVGRPGALHERRLWVPSPVQPPEDGTIGAYIGYGMLAIGGPDLLRALHAEDGIPALEQGQVVGVGPGTVEGGNIHPGLDFSTDGPDLGLDLPAAEAGSTRFASVTQSGLFDYVISPERAAKVGLRVSQKPRWNSHYILRTPGDLSGEDVARAKQVASRYQGASLLTESDLGAHEGTARLYASVAGMAIALAIVGVIVALVAAESRRDQAILVAVGAEPRTRRTVAGASALTVAALAGLIAVPMGFVSTAVFWRADTSGAPVVVPWIWLGLVLVGIPLIAGAAGSLVSREPASEQLLHPIW